ncbi:MAG: peroxiredoxin [Bradyrhizobium sp.]|uniref:peroxiredoxin n=1 Tax=Bradyrhizobium sp. TaxID=376 RepID=UPI001DCBB3FD|nr:peroxiredoxin [Bradyrhizobium sp.]MBV9564233.1 peroxiredoxin [Bradyrhizobium sp.]
MSKKSRKKSSKPPSRPGRPAKAAKAKTDRATKARSVASESGRRAAAAGSHEAASKRLKLSKSTPSSTSTAKRSATAKPAALREGAAAPQFRLPRDGGDNVALSDFAGKKLVLFFYPRADTPGCTREAIDFTRLADAFAEAGTAVVGISADPIKAQDAFRDKHKLAVPLLSDEQHGVLEAYGAWAEKSMYGKTFLGILRTTLLIGPDGRIARVWRRVKVDGHADEVLAAARAL